MCLDSGWTYVKKTAKEKWVYKVFYLGGRNKKTLFGPSTTISRCAEAYGIELLMGVVVQIAHTMASMPLKGLVMLRAIALLRL